jgi:hypothetical protein
LTNLSTSKIASHKSPQRWCSAVITTCSCIAIVATGCKTGIFSGQDHGVPLEEFTAENGSYFPPFIQKFFPGSVPFSKDNGTLRQARHGLAMIQIKQLNAKTSRFNEQNLSWSADGVYLGFEVIERGFRKIMLKNLMGNYARELRVVPKGRQNFLDGMVVESAHSYNAGLRWSRDSTRYAFMSNGGVGEYNIYVGAVGANEKTVARSPTKDGYATWSPATNEIAFVSSRSGAGDIYMVSLDSKKVRRLSNSRDVDIFPDWFPGGNQIVYSNGDALNHNLHIVSRKKDGKNWTRPRYLTKWNRDDLRPIVSPNGKFIAFYSDASGPKTKFGRRWDIIVVPYKPGKTYISMELKKMVVARNVVIDLNTGPAWSPDSRKIFYVKKDPKSFNPIHGYDLFTGREYIFKTNTKMNRDILMSKLGILSFRAQVGVWDKVFVALTNQGTQLQQSKYLKSNIHYLKSK